jgi:hypothetical protein
MLIRLHEPTSIAALDRLPPEHCVRLQRAVARSVERAADALRADGLTVAVARWAATSAGPAAGAARGRPREPYSELADEGDGRYLVPSFGDEGKPIAVEFEQDVLVPGKRDDAVLMTPGGDQVVRADWPKTLVVAARGIRYWFAGGSPHVLTPNVARAVRWGQVLFGGLGFAVFHRGGNGIGAFVTAPLTDPLRVGDLSGFSDRNLEIEGSRFQPVKDFARVVSPAAMSTVAVVTADHVTLLNILSGRSWHPVRFQQAMAAVSARERYVDPRDTELVANALLGPRRGGDADEALMVIVNFDRTMFAAIPWEQRADILEQLIDAWTGKREEIAILELIHATRSSSELEAIFATLRKRGIYEQLFDDLDGAVFSLLETLGEYRAGPPLDWHYVWQILVEVNPSIGVLSVDLSADPLRQLERTAAGMLDWLSGTVEGIWMLLSHPDQVLEGLAHLAELVWLVQKAQYGDQEAQQFVTLMVRKAGRSAALAIEGLRYADELGSPYGKRSTGAGIAGDILGRLKAMVLTEVLSWFVGIGEVKAAVAAVGLGDRLAALSKLLGALVWVGRTGEAAGEVARIQRVMRALGELAKIGESARLARIVELLPAEHAALITKLAREVRLAEDAGIEALRAAVAGKPELLRAVDEVGDALAVAGRLDARAAEVGGVTADMAAGLQRLLRESGWDRATLLTVVEDIPASRLDEFMHALGFVEPAAFRRWGPEAFRALGQRPRHLRLLREAGSDVFEASFRRHRGDWSAMERFIDGLDAERLRIADPAEYQRLLDRIRQGDAKAFEAVDDAFHGQQLAGASAAGRRPAYALERLKRANHRHLLHELDQIEKPAARDHLLDQLADLTDRELRGMDEVVRQNKIGGTQDWADLLLEFPAAERQSVLNLVADVGPHTSEGLDLALRPLFEFGTKNIQGGIGQLMAARTMMRRFPGRSLRFEVSQIRREVDIVVDGGSFPIHVEVKTNQTGSASYKKSQVVTDLVTHAGNHYDDLVYLYHPTVGGELPGIGNRMLRLFGDATTAPDPELVLAFQNWNLDLNQARADFQRWLGGVGTPGGNLTTYAL